MKHIGSFGQHQVSFIGLQPEYQVAVLGGNMLVFFFGKAILMCTHDIFRAKDIANRIGIMKEGRLVLERTREEFEQENLEKIYLNYMQEAVAP